MVDILHNPVFLDEAVSSLVKNSSGTYIDGTFGRGGHSRAILDVLTAQGRLVAIDKDPEAVAVGLHLAKKDARFSIRHDSFASVVDIASENRIDGVLLDLGVSSPQLDDPKRGFSFMKDGPLDMRMDNTRGVSASDWLANAEVGKIKDVLKYLGEEKFATRIARAIVSERAIEPIVRTSRLRDIVVRACPDFKRVKKHPATKTFQAIRIFVNSELDELSKSLELFLDVLKPGGRLVVISFHSLEDRIVKRFIRKHVLGDQEIPKHIPLTEEQLIKSRRLVSKGKLLKVSDEELGKNIRSRSARMRIAETLS